jgi:hypothetical protein
MINQRNKKKVFDMVSFQAKKKKKKNKQTKQQQQQKKKGL